MPLRNLSQFKLTWAHWKQFWTNTKDTRRFRCLRSSQDKIRTNYLIIHTVEILVLDWSGIQMVKVCPQFECSDFKWSFEIAKKGYVRCFRHFLPLEYQTQKCLVCQMFPLFGSPLLHVSIEHLLCRRSKLFVGIIVYLFMFHYFFNLKMLLLKKIN